MSKSFPRHDKSLSLFFVTPKGGYIKIIVSEKLRKGKDLKALCKRPNAEKNKRSVFCLRIWASFGKRSKILMCRLYEVKSTFITHQLLRGGIKKGTNEKYTKPPSGG
ncbi:hypothetical protein CPG38_13690 [Malaciobacter marinus]|nr:hypothetical protein CPG38_13690 [Malaciobacter marinus]